jgi:hypothetical protein
MKTIINYVKDISGVGCMCVALCCLLTWELFLGGVGRITGRQLVGDTDEDREQDLR